MPKWNPSKTWAKKVIRACDELNEYYSGNSVIWHEDYMTSGPWPCPLCEAFKTKLTEGNYSCSKCPWVAFTIRADKDNRLSMSPCEGVGKHKDYRYTAKSQRKARLTRWKKKAQAILDA